MRGSDEKGNFTAVKQYHLDFISDEDIRRHVRETVTQYRRSINLADFNRNVVDPIKLTFDAKVYRQTLSETILTECLRQIDKSNNNCIGYFHQCLFRYAGQGWDVPPNGQQGGFDVVNLERHIYAEIKNKHNTMNYAAANATYTKMQNMLLRDDRATCYLVEVIARSSRDEKWMLSLKAANGRSEQYSHERIRRISMDRFYELVFGDRLAFRKLCEALPLILDDVLEQQPELGVVNTVLDELGADDLQNRLYAMAFAEYEGFKKEDYAQ